MEVSVQQLLYVNAFYDVGDEDYSLTLFSSKAVPVTALPTVSRQLVTEAVRVLIKVTALRMEKVRGNIVENLDSFRDSYAYDPDYFIGRVEFWLEQKRKSHL